MAFDSSARSKALPELHICLSSFVDLHIFLFNVGLLGPSFPRPLINSYNNQEEFFCLHSPDFFYRIFLC